MSFNEWVLGLLPTPLLVAALMAGWEDSVKLKNTQQKCECAQVSR